MTPYRKKYIYRYLPHHQTTNCSRHLAAKEKSAGDQRKDNDLLLHNVVSISSSGDAHGTINFSKDTPASFRVRHASTSTLDLLNSLADGAGDDPSKHNNHQCATSLKNKSSVSNKLDFNNLFGMMRKSKDARSNKLPLEVATTNHAHTHRVGRLKPAKNVYFIDDQKDNEPNIFIIDAESINDRRERVHYARKSMEDIFSVAVRHRKSFNDDEHEPWNFASRQSYASRTLPRDFCRRNVRAGLGDVFDNYHHQTSHQVERWVEYILCVWKWKSKWMTWRESESE